MLTYTTHVGNFVSYIKAEKLYDVIDVSLDDVIDVSLKDVDAFIVQLGKMRSNYRKEQSRDDRIREELDKIRTYLKSSTVSDYMQSESAADALSEIRVHSINKCYKAGVLSDEGLFDIYD